MAELPERAVEICRMRPDIRETFDLSTASGRTQLYWWYYIHAFREMWLDFRSPDDFKGPVNDPVEHLPFWGPLPVTWLMRELWLRGSLNIPARLSSNGTGRSMNVFRRPGRREPRSRDEHWHLLSWYFCRGLDDYNLQGLVTAEQVAGLVDLRSSNESVPPLLKMAHDLATDLHACYPTAASAEWLKWCAADGVHRFAIFGHPSVRIGLFGAARKPPKARTYEGEAVGVNLIGHAMARSGVGEDLRMAAHALEAAGIPFVIRNVLPSSGVASEEAGLEPHLSDHSPFRINMFCMAGMETVTMLAQNRSLLEGKLNIGFWPWELPQWPQLWSHAPTLMDELWASTSFTAAAYRRSTHVPVRQVPMAVNADSTQGLGRCAFGLPESHFLFGFSFDGYSSFNRKNPEATISAFRLAFPDFNEPVSLVLKGLRVNDHPAWHRLESLAAQDPRIILISASLPRGALLDLYRSMDCFVSLHRSEGFGRNIAECMLLGKPVIVTNYSGNVDFSRASTAALVNSNRQRIGDGEYPFGAGQSWGDPDVTEAAQHMRQMFLQKDLRDRIARAGQQYISTHYSAAAVGEKLSSELRRIRERISDDATS
jgi:hypothetical protein